MIDTWTIVEFVAMFFGVLSVYLTVKQKIWCWPTGIVMVILYMMIFYNVKLYSDMLENFIYIFMQIYGWWFWVVGGKVKDTVPVRTLGLKGRLFWLGVIGVGTAVLGGIMARTDAALPYLDALTTVMSLVAQWLMGRKLLENWVLWIAVDVLALGIYGFKGLYFTTGLYALFLILATKGFIEWKRAKQKA
jgi:nicotinamide mononucleotide transporter